MPTYGWILEDAWEAFLDGTDPRSAPEYSEPQISCPFCPEQVALIGDLLEHLDTVHRISRPLLLMDGREPAADAIVRTSSRFDVSNATSTSIGIDGAAQHEVSLNKISGVLASCRDEIALVIITNAGEQRASPVSSTYRLRFRIADRAVLRGVESAFVTNIVGRGLSLDAISNFLADRRCDGSAADYAEGFAAYCTGILVKERPEGQTITSPHSHYRQLFGAALERLAPHRSPLPQLICTIIRFALNDFTRSNLTGYWDLDLALAMLRGPNANLRAISAANHSSARRLICPLDDGSARILALAGRLFATERWSATTAEECRQVSSATSLDLMDRQKALALWGLTAWRLGALTEAQIPLSQIVATYPFSNWTEQCLKEINP